MEQCVALVDYDALAPDELSFRKGDVINVTGKGSASGFWEGYVATRHDVPPPLPPTTDHKRRQQRSDKDVSTPGHADPSALGTTEHRVREEKNSGLFANCFVTSNLRTMSSPSFVNKAVCLYAYDAHNDSAEPEGSRMTEGGERSRASGKVGGEEKEMSFARGDVLTVVRPSSYPGWWFGVNESARQRMQLQLLHEKRKDTQPPLQGKNTGTNGKQEAPTSAAEDTATAQRLPLSRRDLLPLHGNDPSAASAEMGELTSVQVQRIEQYCGSMKCPLLFPSNFVSCDIVQAVFPFASREWFELSCDVGDVILVHRRWNDGWWEGALRGHLGIFPSNYTVPNACTTRPAFFCPICKTIYDDTKTANMGLFLAQNNGNNVSSPFQQCGSEPTVVIEPNRNNNSEMHRVTTPDKKPSDSPAFTDSSTGLWTSSSLWRECATCAQHAQVTSSMLEALIAYDAGELDKLDLFAFVRTDVTAAAAKATSLGSSRTRHRHGASQNCHRGLTVNGEGDGDSVADESEGSDGLGSEGESGTVAHSRSRRSRTRRPGERASDEEAGGPSLLNAKDVVDISAAHVNIVKQNR